MQGTVNVYATAAHIRDTDTCTDDEHDTAMVIITAQAQLDETRAVMSPMRVTAIAYSDQ